MRPSNATKTCEKKTHRKGWLCLGGFLGLFGRDLKVKSSLKKTFTQVPNSDNKRGHSLVRFQKKIFCPVYAHNRIEVKPQTQKHLLLLGGRRWKSHIERCCQNFLKRRTLRAPVLRRRSGMDGLGRIKIMKRGPIRNTNYTIYNLFKSYACKNNSFYKFQLNQF